MISSTFQVVICIREGLLVIKIEENKITSSVAHCTKFFSINPYPSLYKVFFPNPSPLMIFWKALPPLLERGVCTMYSSLLIFDFMESDFHGIIELFGIRIFKRQDGSSIAHCRKFWKIFKNSIMGFNFYTKGFDYLG